MHACVCPNLLPVFSEVTCLCYLLMSCVHFNVCACCRPVATGAMMQPVPLVQVQQDAEGRMVSTNTAPLSRQQWQAMAEASGWSNGKEAGNVGRQGTHRKE